MKLYVSIIIALISFFTAPLTSEAGDTTLEKGYCCEYGYYLQEYSSGCEMPSDALTAGSNISIQQLQEGKQGNHPFSKYSVKDCDTTNKCGRHLHRVSLLHNSLPDITVSHRHIFLLGRLII